MFIGPFCGRRDLVNNPGREQKNSSKIFFDQSRSHQKIFAYLLPVKLHINTAVHIITGLSAGNYPAAIPQIRKKLDFGGQIWFNSINHWGMIMKHTITNVCDFLRLISTASFAAGHLAHQRNDEMVGRDSAS